MTKTCGSILAIRRYPVKSMRGESLEASTITARGLGGDRAFALIDRAGGKVVSAKHPRLWGRLLDCRAVLTTLPDSCAAPAVRITLPNGRFVSDREEAEELLSVLLDREVTLSAEPPPKPEIDRYWPDIAGLRLRDTVTTGAIGLGAPPGTFLDHAPVHLLTTATLAHLRTLHPDGRIEVERFRPNLLIASPAGTPGFVENDWVGRTLLVGDEVRLRVTDPTPRCVVPTLPQPDLPQDIGVLKAIAAHNRPTIPALDGAAQPCLGVYAVVEQGGTIRLQDEVRPA
ncbi:MAG: MOSC domain-containing protein [Chloroflexota bacterium]